MHHQPNPLGNLNLYDPNVRAYILQNYPQYAGYLPQVAPPPQPIQQPQFYGQPQYAAPQTAPGQDFGLSIAEQQFLYQNANLIPLFYQTPDGKALNKMLVEGLQKMLGVNSGQIPAQNKDGSTI
ncbi:hypothetical protein ACR9GP_08105 [Enterobacter ludwigii]